MLLINGIIKYLNLKSTRIRLSTLHCNFNHCFFLCVKTRSFFFLRFPAGMSHRNIFESIRCRLSFRILYTLSHLSCDVVQYNTEFCVEDFRMFDSGFNRTDSERC